MSNQTTTVLENCKISYARSGKTLKGNSTVSGILQQRNQDGKFQASFSFECYEADVLASLLSAASRIEAVTTGEELANESVVPVDHSLSDATVTVTGYYKSRAPKEGSGKKDWKLSFIVESVRVVNV